MGTDWKRFLRSVACCFVPVMGLVVGIQEYASAQGVGGSLGSFFPVPIVGSFEPVTTFEKICGPLLPKCDIGNSFRSEFGVGYRWPSMCAAKLTTTNGVGATVDYDLRGVAALDQEPPYIEFFGDLRLWRLGLRPAYVYFDNRSVNSRFGKLALNGFTLGIDVDALHHEWLTFGASIDAYFFNPQFNGRFFRNGITNPVPPAPDQTEPIIVSGDRPYTWGLYFRYMPPAILGLPTHFNAFVKAPLAGSKLLWYGFDLSFRPQIYRFDLACKLGYEQAHFTFVPSQSADLKMEWQFYKLEFAAYF